MRHAPPLVWEFVEAESEEWEELTTAALSSNKDEVERPWRSVAFVATVAILMVLAALLGYRLWLEAEAGAAQIEHEIDALVHMEALQQRALDPAEIADAAVESVRFDNSGVMVCVIVTATMPLSDSVTYRETRFYQPVADSWQRTEPLLSFWGRKAEMNTATVHFDFHDLDLPFVEAIAASIENYHQSVRSLLELPPLTASSRMTVTIVPNSVPLLGTLKPDGTIELPSLIMVRAPAYGQPETAVYVRLRSLLTTKLIREALGPIEVRQQWLLFESYLGDWFASHADDLQIVADSAAFWRQQEGFAPCRQAQHFGLRDLYLSPWSSANFTSQPDKRHGVLAFYDYIACGDTQATIPTLLAAFGEYATWDSLAPAVFDMSADELQSAWHLFVEESKQDDGDARQ